ncbi:MAG TPA: 7-carboxy-7-deazaguanine synthase QueE [Candidatus Omnitrophica bacterium]|nr:7-carboxy-7-deazaguanine synthase QueE [Candidatus Omnitrophota bacterium]
MQIAKISEIFKSTQGEGLYLGVEQLFVRFFGCNIKCGFCDTRQRDFKEYSAVSLKGEVSRSRDIHSLCLTGGEPLVQSDFLKEFLPAARTIGPKIYLETNGTLPYELSGVIDLIDIVAMDIKLPSATGQKAFWAEHEEFLSIAKKKSVFIKMVITGSTQQEDIVSVTGLIKKIEPDIYVVLQPNWFDVDSALLNKMVGFKKYFLEAGVRNVKIMPQAHKYAGIR